MIVFILPIENAYLNLPNVPDADLGPETLDKTLFFSSSGQYSGAQKFDEGI